MLKGSLIKGTYKALTCAYIEQAFSESAPRPGSVLFLPHTGPERLTEPPHHVRLEIYYY